MKKRLISIFLLVIMLVAQIPVEAIAAAGNQIRTAINTVQEKENSTNPFIDVQEGSWYYDAVQYARINNFFSGTSVNTFDPNGMMSRGMFVTVLGRMAGVDQAAYLGQSEYIDVPLDAYYAPYVAWAAKYGITVGTGNGKFDPNGIINREQMAVFFVRYFETFGVNYDTGENITTVPADIESVSPWARDAVLKLWKTGLLAGDGVNFNPTDIASRAQAAALCMRTDKAVEVWYKEPGVSSDRVSIDLDVKNDSDSSKSDSKNNSKDDSKNNPRDDYRDDIEDSHPGGNNTTYYKITFVTDSTRKEQLHQRNTLLSTLPNPAQPTGKVFLGWYYDIEKTKPVSGEDKLTSDITLYAKFADAMSLDEGGTLNYVSALDQEPSFSILVEFNSDSEPKQGIDFKFRNITAPDKTPEGKISEEDLLNIETVEVKEIGNGIWEVSSANGGFTPGHTYQIELINDNLIYDDSADAFGNLKQNNAKYDINEVRFFNFSIIKDKGTLNLKLNNDIKYINVDDDNLNPEDRVSLMEYAGLYMASTDNSGITTYTANNGRGSFTYTGEEDIQVGDIVAFYKGTKPTERKPEKGTKNKTNNGEVSYVKITAIDDGSTYYYVAAEGEDVIFTPDVLPIDVDVNDGTEGWTLNGSSLSIDNQKLEFFIDQYEEMSQKIDTTLDVGDYLAFYTGDFGKPNAKDEAYGEILSIEVKEDKTVVEYRRVEQSDVMSAMDLYDETQLSESEIEDVINENKEEIQRIIEAQLMESDFFDEAGEYLAGLAIKTDEVREVFGDDLTLSNCIITYADGTPIGKSDLALMGNIVDKDQEGKKPAVSVIISPKLSHFSQTLGGIGVRVEVAVDYIFKIQKSGSDKLMEIELTAFFEQEITIGFSVSGGAVWKKKWIIPYIADYRMNGNMDLGTYTGIGITATAKLREGDEPWGMSWPKSKEEAELTRDIFSLSESIKELMEDYETVFPEKEVSGDGGLADKYADFMEDANEDWIDLVEVDLLELHSAMDPLHILAFGLDIDFVVSANLNVALGMTFQYENLKRHSFTMTLKSKTAESDTVDLSTNGYQLDLYVMGHLGIKAGIRAKAMMGLFSTKLAGIGLQIESGAYARLWGYFYYHLENYKVNGVWQKDSGYSGALLVEIGAYLDIKFIAEVLNGKYSYEPSIYAKEWPLWSAGQQENVYDFAYEDNLSFDILNVDTYTIPSMVYDMLWMDLKTGEIEEGDEANIKNFDSNKEPDPDKVNESNEEYFVVELSNPNFTYNPANNQVTIDKSSGAVEQSCDMKITWKGTPLSGSSEVLSRTIMLNWSNDANAATIAFESNGGSAVQMIRLLAGTPIADKMPQEPTRLGYTFSGWYIDKNLTQPFTANTMPAGNTTLYAKWTPNTVNYTVEHYKQNLNGQYDIEDTENTWSGIVGTETTAINKDYEGFTAQTVKQQTIAADGSTRVAIYYDRNSYDLRFDYDNDNGNVVTVKMPYGSKILDTIKSLNPVREGYEFNGWDKTIPNTMPAGNLSLKALWTPGTNTLYRVKHIKENLDGTYPTSGGLVKIESLIGTTGQYTNAIAETYTGFTPQEVVQKQIAADGSTVVEIKYTRNKHNLSWNVNGGDALKGAYTSGTIKYGTAIIQPEIPTRDGYTFIGWYKDEAMTVELKDNETMPDTDLTLFAKWDSTQASYMVSHMLEGLDGEYELVETQRLTGAKGGNTNAIAKTYEGFTAQPVEQKKIEVDGSTVVEIKYTRNSYKLTWNFNGGYVLGVDDLEGKYTDIEIKYGAAIIKPETPARDGYSFGGWYKDVDMIEELENNATMPAADLIITAKWIGEERSYTVKHMKEDLNGGYPDIEELVEIETLTGITDQYTNAVAKTNYEGFTAQPVEQKKIAADGSTVVEIKYTRNEYSLTWDVNGGDELQGQYTSGIVKYGTTIIKPIEPTRTNYIFGGWYEDEDMTVKLEDDATMPASALTLYAKWIEYKIWVEGVQVTSDNLENVLSDGTVSYDDKTNTLILNGAKLKGHISKIEESSTEHTGAIYAIGDLNIELVSNSNNEVLNDSKATGGSEWACGIYVTGNLTISGSGTLNVTGGTGTTSHGISVGGKLIIEETNIISIGQEASGVSAIFARGDIIIIRSTVEAIANKSASGSSCGIESYGTINISGGNVIATADVSNSVFSGTGSYGITASEVIISGGIVNASGKKAAIIALLTADGMKIMGSKEDVEPTEEYDPEEKITNYKRIKIEPYS